MTNIDTLVISNEAVVTISLTLLIIVAYKLNKKYKSYITRTYGE